jgi:ribonuclease P protein component
MLRSPRDFAAIQAGSRTRSDRLLVVRIAPNRLEVTRFGFSTGRRLGGAVIRNRIRRRLREILRALGPRLRPGSDVLVVARPPAVAATFQELRQALERLLRQSGVLRDEGTNA